MKRVAIIVSHPIQYYAPWFRYLVNNSSLVIKVFYLWNFGVTRQIDPGFRQLLQWDIPLLEGYDHEFVPNTSKNPGTHHFWGLQNPSLGQQVKTWSPDAVLLMNYNYDSLYRFINQWDTHRIPLLFRGDSHRLLPETGLKAWIRRQWITQVYRQFAACLYVGQANYDYFRYHGVTPERLFFSPHAIDNERFRSHGDRTIQQSTDWKQELGIPTDQAVILFVGKFEPKKRPLDLLQAFLQAKLPQVSLLFVGSGSLEHALKSAAVGQPNLYFAPFQNQTLMPRTYAVADLVVLPSCHASETWGLVINEAMCLGRPVMVSTLVGCAQDLVHPFHNGLIFPAGDVMALCQSLKEAFSDRLRLQQWGAESQRLIETYSYAQVTQGLMQALDYTVD